MVKTLTMIVTYPPQIVDLEELMKEVIKLMHERGCGQVEVGPFEIKLLDEDK